MRKRAASLKRAFVAVKLLRSGGVPISLRCTPAAATNREIEAMMLGWKWLAAVSGLLILSTTFPVRGEAAKGPTAAGPVSYYKDIRPIFQAHCQGCHQPAKAKGEYIMTDFAKLLAGGESGKPAVVPRQPNQSALLEMLVPHQGKAKMPKGKSPLSETD